MLGYLPACLGKYRLSSLSEDRDQVRVALIQYEQRWGERCGHAVSSLRKLSSGGCCYPNRFPSKFQPRLGYRSALSELALVARPLIREVGKLPVRCWDLNTCEWMFTHERFDQEERSQDFRRDLFGSSRSGRNSEMSALRHP